MPRQLAASAISPAVAMPSLPQSRYLNFFFLLFAVSGILYSVFEGKTRYYSFISYLY